MTWLPPLGAAMIPVLGVREPVSAATHLLAGVASVFAAAVLWRRSEGDRPKQLSMLVYGASLVALFLASAAYHALDVAPGSLDVLRRIDHCAIFLLIAGTFTPACFNGARGGWRTGPLLVVWGLAVLGMASRWLRIDLSDEATAGLYIGLGALTLSGYGKLAAVISRRAVAWTVVGGAIYSTGAVIDVIGWPWGIPGVFGPHEVFHVAVVVAGAMHYAAVLRYVVPVERQRRPIVQSAISDPTASALAA
jgi:hemolysin III